MGNFGGAIFDVSGELGEGENWDVKFAGDGFEGASDVGNFLDAVHGVGAAHELQIIDDDQVQTVFHLEAAGFGANVEGGAIGGVVDENVGFGKLVDDSTHAVKI